MSLFLSVFAIILAAVSGLPGLFGSRTSERGQWIATGFMVCSGLMGLSGGWLGLWKTPSPDFLFPWLAAIHPFVRVDALSGFFLFPIFLMGGLGSIYGLGYWPQSQQQGNARQLRLFWGLLVAGMALLVISKHGMVFLLGWEVMALAGFFLISTEDHRDECRRAGWIYLMATHVSTLTLFALFALWHWATGSYTLEPVTGQTMSLGVMNGLFFLALIGFGLKAGVMPLHFWLPDAHAHAPSHVSAILSGVVIKMGIYGLVRFVSLLPTAPSIWGGLLLTLGGISGLLGVVFALGQHDLKRLLAYHSVENIGIILMGLGLAMLGRSLGQPTWVVLGLAGCLLHVWNHSLFKALLFLCAGSVLHRTHTRQIDQLGGLAKRMPWTSAMFLVGAVAICGLPPLNGFVSEWFVYLGLFKTITTVKAGGTAAAFAVPVLAMIGALAVACFVKVYGVVFLGSPRSAASADASESPLTMRGPMVVLAVCCVWIGLAPMLFISVIDQAIGSWNLASVSAPMSLGIVAPLWVISVMSVLLIVCIGVLALVWMRRMQNAPRVVTWDCGYAAPTNRMQYTASSFAQMIVAMFSWVLRPHTQRPNLEGPFPESTKMHSHVDDVVLDRVLVPTGRRVERWFGWFRRFQQGLTQYYVLYILITVILMLSTLIPFGELFARLFVR